MTERGKERRKEEGNEEIGRRRGIEKAKGERIMIHWFIRQRATTAQQLEQGHGRAGTLALLLDLPQE